MSRPEKPIDWAKVDQLLMAGCLGTEIAAHFDMHQNTFYARVEEKYKMSFTHYCAEKRAKGDSLLRAKQFERALSGKSDTMLIWLGKQRLGQKEIEEARQTTYNIVVPNDLSIGTNIPAKTLPDTDNKGSE